jgi:hypothetical protein
MCILFVCAASAPWLSNNVQPPNGASASTSVSNADDGVRGTRQSVCDEQFRAGNQFQQQHTVSPYDSGQIKMTPPPFLLFSLFLLLTILLWCSPSLASCS